MSNVALQHVYYFRKTLCEEYIKNTIIKSIERAERIPTPRSVIENIFITDDELHKANSLLSKLGACESTGDHAERREASRVPPLFMTLNYLSINTGWVRLNNVDVKGIIVHG